jgi:hypothetical protein
MKSISVHTVYLCALCGPYNKHRSLTAFIMVMDCVLCEVQSEFLYVFQKNISIRRVKLFEIRPIKVLQSVTKICWTKFLRYIR